MTGAFCIFHKRALAPTECWWCNGTGAREDPLGDELDLVEQTCWHCNGRGEVDLLICEWCEEERRELEEMK